MSVVIPFYNEAACARLVAEELGRALAAAGLDYELVLVDNGSRDDTAGELAAAAGHDARARVITVPRNLGYGYGVIEGMRSARGRYVAVVPGDGQLAPEDAARVLARVHARRPPFCKGVRGDRGRTALRWAVSILYNRLFGILFGVRTRDINAPPKIIERETLARMAPASRDWFLDAEMMLKAQELNLPVEEVELNFRPRAGGRSHVRPGALWEFARNMVRYRLTGGRPWKEGTWTWT